MRALLRSRQPAQIIAFSAVGMIMLLGAVAIVIDLGIYFVIQREMQNAADASVLAAVWYPPVCNPASMAQGGCGTAQTCGQAGAPPSCPAPPDTSTCQKAGRADPVACTVAYQVAMLNLHGTQALCNGPHTTQAIQIDPEPGQPGQLIHPVLQPYVVTISCDAQHWFGQILPGVLPQMHISASSAATIGWRDAATGDVTDQAPSPGQVLMARLLLANNS